jgi:hypothetical protein
MPLVDVADHGVGPGQGLLLGHEIADFLGQSPQVRAASVDVCVHLG